MDIEVTDAHGNKQKLSIECLLQKRWIQIITKDGGITRTSNYDAENSMDAEFALHDSGLSDEQIAEILPEIVKRMKFPY